VILARDIRLINASDAQLQYIIEALFRQNYETINLAILGENKLIHQILMIKF